ncbi:MAG: DUF2807 domain-containing protein [Methylococcales bacterium]|nr:DUF2807 domain-containing protein [Methylococcales bacterium]
MQLLNLFYKTLLTCSACFFNVALAGNGSVVIENSIISGGNITVDGHNVGGILKGSGAYQSKKQTLSPYNTVIIDGNFDVNYYRKNTSSAKISADQNLLPFVNVNVKNTTLYLKMDKSYRTKQPIVIDIYSPNLNAMTVHGASDVQLNSIRANSFKIHLTGSGDISANGNTKTLNVIISGSGDINAKKLIAQKATVDLKGSADVTITARKKLDISISGSGDVTYFGNPERINKSISGSGDISSGD